MKRTSLLFLFTLTELLCIIIPSLSEAGCSQWSRWTHCSATCGGGQRLRERQCPGRHLNRKCRSTLQVRNCSPLPCKSKGLKVNIEGVGCFADGTPRALNTLLANLRSSINWWRIDKTVVRCAQLARARGWRYFGVQFYGECWSSTNAEDTYSRYGRSRNCWNGVGQGGTNFVYRVKH